MCGVAQHDEDTPGWGRQGTTPANDVATLQNEQVVYVPNKKYRNFSGEVKHQQELRKDYFNQVGALAGQDRI